jgi:hypothetical protein
VGTIFIRAHHFRDFFPHVIEILGNTVGLKWTVLFLLHKGKKTNYTWDEMAPLLSTCSTKVAQLWQDTFNYLFFNPIKPPIPKEWSAVCTLFSSPPPNLNPTELEKWYSEQIETLRQAL